MKSILEFLVNNKVKQEPITEFLINKPITNIKTTEYQVVNLKGWDNSPKLVIINSIDDIDSLIHNKENNYELKKEYRKLESSHNLYDNILTLGWCWSKDLKTAGLGRFNKSDSSRFNEVTKIHAKDFTPEYWKKNGWI